MNLGTAELEEGVMGDTAGWKGKGEISGTVFYLLKYEKEKNKS